MANQRPRILALSFLANCLIVFPVAASPLHGSSTMTETLGPDTVARPILSSVYLGIGALSRAARGLMA
ncbi:hypothetical protein [uncultured Roseobacter sp.]|uniref:hypothetical protein n=1 Tax=uncultured Roseobacter sp. TaxID=114847 RepID=UPI00260356A9|nr:hypothetical protein [uncultured Roseobacter sp.]